MVTGVECNMPGLVERAAAAEVALSAESSTLAMEKEKAIEALQDLQIARPIVANKEQELERAIQTKLVAYEDMGRAQAELEIPRAELVDAVTARVEAEKTAEEEFEAGFFQGYADLKRRVVVDYPEWDLSAYSGGKLKFLGGRVLNY